MTEETQADGLFYILLQYDNTWHITYSFWDGCIIENNKGVIVNAPSLLSALKAALSLYGVGYDTHRD